MRKLILISLFTSIISSCSNDDNGDPCACKFTLSSRTGIENDSYYAETIVSMPNPCDSYLGQNIDTSFQLYENDGTFENPVKGPNRVGPQRTGSILFTRDYLTALNRLNIGVGSTFSIDAIEYTVQEYNCN